MEDQLSVLKKYFGYDSFRPLQKDIIDHVLSGNDSLVLMPTGGGKSICFQLPALLKEGVCLVISPLIALMKDQVEALRANGIQAAFINSTLNQSQQNEIEQACYSGRLKLLYVSPEKLFATGFLNFIKQLNINLFAVDEAHCVSFWGHDFRPEYMQLKQIKEHFPGIPMIALTATADKVTRKDILQQLGMPKAEVFISSFDRPNLSLKVLPGQKRINHIIDFLQSRKDQSGIVYCLSRKTTEEIAEKLRKSGYNARHYHAGMDHEYRAKTQEDFIKDDVQIICATIAFGMGIDKSNVRWVIHYNLPKNLENFYQEIGRAGRDGLQGDTLLFYSFQDFIVQTDMLKDLTPERRELQAAKLERMKQYAEADICRRRILISYFNETFDKDCGNCDVCLNPRTKFDGTLIAQKALSAIARSKEEVAMTMLIDILRGSRNKTLLDKGYHELKTFGAGREFPPGEWMDYLLQLLNGGILDIAYDEGHSFKLNELSWQVLKENRKVMMVKYQPFYEKKQAQDLETKTKSKGEQLFDKLFERLKKVRKEFATRQNVPAYIIFNDNTLTEMAKEKPLSEIDMLGISGVGHQKFNQYGAHFLKEITDFIKEEAQEGSKVQGATYLFTLDLYNKGFSVEEIAKERNLSQTTIISHLCALFEKGSDIDLSKYISPQEFAEVRKALEVVKIENNALKPVFDFLGGKMDYSKIRVAATLMNRKSLVKK